MLRRNQEILRTLVVLTDLLVISSAWMTAFFVRFYTIFPTPYVPPTAPYVKTLLFVLPLWFLLFRAAGLYDPKRTTSFAFECNRIFRFSLLGLSILVGTSFFAQVTLPRTVAALFFIFVVLFGFLFRFCLRLLLGTIRRRGRNLRHVLIIGVGPQTHRFVKRIVSHKELGIKIFGILNNDGTIDHVEGIPVVGHYDDLPRILTENKIDDVILTLPSNASKDISELFATLQNETVNVQLVPDIPELFRLTSSIEDIDGLPIVSVSQGPLVGWAALQKQAIDVSVSLLSLLLLSPILILISLLIAFTSGRPMFYSQARMGLDGKTFKMFKFRTMGKSAEEETGPTWARPDDPRRTKIGTFLRKTSLDELPQLWNVLRGDMSIVGPRPERPIFINSFQKELPGYMLRHKVKSGMTGWAQINGWRGNTSINERLKYDIYYIDNWSLALDFKIMILTFWRVIFDRNAY